MTALTAELDAFERRLFTELERIVSAVEAVDPRDAARPPMQGANALVVLATHALGAAESHIVKGLCQGPLSRDRSSEFTAPLGPEALRSRLGTVTARIHGALGSFDPRRLDDPRPGDEHIARDWLVHAIAHAAEHAGQAELTRDLFRAPR